MFTFNPTPETKGVRLDIFLVEQLGISRSEIQKMIRAGLITVNGKLPKKPGDPLNREAVIEIAENQETASVGRLVDGQHVDTYGVEIVADEPDYLVINKPAGLLVHPTDAHEPVTLANWIIEKYPDVRGVGDRTDRSGIVHRLDKEASGLLVIAKTQPMFDSLKAQFQDRSIEKVYRVLVHGIVEKDHDVINFDIDRGPEGRMVSRPKVNPLSVKSLAKQQPGKEALTEFLVRERYTRFTLLEVRIHTGRTHQIRVHMFAYNHPVVGDTLYVNRGLNLKRDERLGRLFLHAEKLCFDTRTGERVCYEAPLPEELQAFLLELK